MYTVRNTNRARAALGATGKKGFAENRKRNREKKRMRKRRKGVALVYSTSCSASSKKLGRRFCTYP